MEQTDNIFQSMITLNELFYTVIYYKGLELSHCNHIYQMITFSVITLSGFTVLTNGYHLSGTKQMVYHQIFYLSISNTNHFFITKLNCSSPNQDFRSFKNRSFKFLSKTGQRMNWGPQGFTFSTLYCFPNLT